MKGHARYVALAIPNPKISVAISSVQPGETAGAWEPYLLNQHEQENSSSIKGWTFPVRDHKKTLKSLKKLVANRYQNQLRWPFQKLAYQMLETVQDWSLNEHEQETSSKLIQNQTHQPSLKL